MINSVGEFSIFYGRNSVDAKTMSIASPQKNDAIKTDGDNVLRTEWRDGTLSFFINGTQVHTMQYPYQQKVGLEVSALVGL